MRKLILFLCLSLTMSSASWAAPKLMTVDVAARGEPISRYIYGQFIEHLGKGVYGGLWAEMLEDRKFYFSITDMYAPWGTSADPNWGSGPYQYLAASPWKVAGPAGTVTMDTTKPFTGIHSPVVHLPDDGTAAGISQEGLALQNGKAYTGRIVLAADPGVTVIVRLVQDSGQAAAIPFRGAGARFAAFPFQLVSPGTSDNARLEILGTGKGAFTVGAVSLMPADAIDGWRRDVVELLKELDAPIYRWPGGNFVSGYDWRDGIGDRDSRPPRKNPAWKGVESNDVGIHEFMDLMAIIGAEPYVSLNTGLGSVENAAEEVEYCVGSTDTPMGKLRAVNRHPDPFPVTWWAVGNEMFGQWQLGYMPIGDYIKKHNSVVEAIRKVSPAAHLVGVGSVGAWDRAILAGASMDLISEHIYRRDLANVDAHSRQLANDIDRIARIHRDYRRTIPALAGKDIRIAMDEWNYWYGPYIYGELGVQYHLRDALGIARGLHAFFRNSDLYFIANYAQTVNVIGAIKVTRTAAALDTTGMVLQLYRARFGSVPVRLSGASGRLDVSAAVTTDGKALTVAVVNALAAADEVRFSVRGASLSGAGTRWTLTGPGPDSTNEPGKPPNVTVSEASFSPGAPSLQVPRYSITIFRYELSGSQR